MKSFKCLILLPGFFFFVSTSMAVESKTTDTKKTKAHHCAMFKRNAMKAKHLYAMSRAKAEDLKNQVKVLKKDQKRLPAEARTTKKIVIEKIHMLSDVKTQKLAISLKYLENHIYFIKEARKNCENPRVELNKKKPRKLEKVKEKVLPSSLYEIAVN